MTPAQVEKATAEYLSKIAQAHVAIEKIDNIMYVFGSELGCLRIFAHHNSNGAVPNPKARVGYSVNLASWYFSLSLDIGLGS